MGKKLLTDRIKTFIHKYWIILFILGTGVYFVSCVAVNFISSFYLLWILSEKNTEKEEWSER